MKYLIILLVFFPVYSQTADFRGHVKDNNEGTNFSNVMIEMIQGEEIRKSQTDIDGNFTIKNLSFGAYKLQLSYSGYRNLIIKEFYFSRNDRIFEFVYPNPCKSSEKICPKNHKDKLIPIVYGLPGEKLLKKAKKGKIKLGGCVVTDCDPKWYCKLHNESF